LQIKPAVRGVFVIEPAMIFLAYFAVNRTFGHSSADFVRSTLAADNPAPHS
jgi:alkyl hydroperoxide reductase subunit AhpC